MTLDFDFTDYFRLTRPTEKQVAEWKDYMGASMPAPTSASGKRGLRVIMEATHAGTLNRNNRIYIPSRMAEGVSSFRTGEKPTKLLKQHDLSRDPVGVIRGARFVPTVPDELANNPDVINLMSSSAPIDVQLKSMRNLWRSGVLSQDGWKGLGFIELIGDVYDQETIEQLHDGRFDAVSTSFQSPGHAYCFVCGQNWAKDGFCEHEMGEMYSADDSDSENSPKVPAIAIAGLHKYRETSFVTLEGDEHVTVKIMDKANTNNNKTFFLPDNWKEEPTITETTFEFKDFKEDHMAKRDEIVLSDAEQKVFDIIKKLRAENKEEDLVELAKKIISTQGEDGLLPDQQEAELDYETAVQYALENLETSDQKVDADAVYADFEKELDELKLSDAKLSEKSRKGLPSSAFCGPDRSFPVPDCAHVTAARRLIGRYKGPGNKTTILACVNRKAKSLGCDSSGDSKDPKNNEGQINLLPCAEDSIKDMKDADIRNLYMAIELEMISRGQKMAYECKECALHEEKVKKAAEDVSTAKAEVNKMHDTLVILREELQRSYADYAAQVDMTVEAKASLHAEKVENLALIGVLNGKYDNLDKAKDDIKDKDLSKLEEVVKDGFDLESVTTKLNDGMARTPQGSVDDPTLNTDGNNPRITDLSGPALAAVENIKDYVKEGKISDAKHIYATMRTLKLFPDELTFESLSVEEQTTE